MAFQDLGRNLLSSKKAALAHTDNTYKQEIERKNYAVTKENIANSRSCETCISFSLSNNFLRCKNNKKIVSKHSICHLFTVKE